LKAVLLTFFVEGAFYVEEGVFSTKTGAGVAKNIQIHNLFTFYRRVVSGRWPGGELAVRCGLLWWFGGIVMEDSRVWLVE
jgi:hypothetical protein